jgi:hypothetical protein
MDVRLGLPIVLVLLVIRRFRDHALLGIGYAVLDIDIVSLAEVVSDVPACVCKAVV